MSTKKKGLTRRGLLKKGAVVATAGFLTPPQTTVLAAQSPAVVTRRRFKAWISRGDGPGRTTLHEVTLRLIGGRQIVVRTEASDQRGMGGAGLHKGRRGRSWNGLQLR